MAVQGWMVKRYAYGGLGCHVYVVEEGLTTGVTCSNLLKAVVLVGIEVAVGREWRSLTCFDHCDDVLVDLGKVFLLTWRWGELKMDKGW